MTGAGKRKIEQYGPPTLHKVIGTCPEIDLTLGGIKLRTLVDSGAQVSTITETFYRENLDSAELHDMGKVIRIMSGSGTDMPYVGCIFLSVSAYGVEIGDVAFLIVKDPLDPVMRERKLKVPGVLGANALKDLKNVLLNVNVNIPVEIQTVLTFIEEIKPVHNNCNTGSVLVRINSKKPVLVPARSLQVVTGTIPPVTEPFTGIIEENNIPLPRGLKLGPCAVAVDKSRKVSFQLANFSDTDVFLQPRLPIGVLSPAEVEPSVDVIDVGVNEVKVVETSYNPAQTFASQILSRMDVSNTLSDTQRTNLEGIISKHQSTFSNDEDDIGYCDAIKHRIVLADDKPVRVPHRRVPPSQWAEVRAYIRRSLDTGLIRESSSPYASPVVLVRKGEKLRVCCDYRSLNLKTRKDAYPLPRIDEALTVLNGAKYFCSLDLAHGFHQIAVEEEDIEKTAFRIGTGGLYEYLRMPFGLTGAPATFMRLMDRIFGDQNFQNLLIYLDDILIFGSSFEETLDRLDMVLERLSKFNLKVRPEKCQLFKERLRYLGHVVSEDGIAPDADKISAIINWQRPKTEKQLRGFLGIAGYYRKFVPGFAKIAAPLHALLQDTGSGKKRKKATRSGCGIEAWDSSCDGAFDELKRKLTTAPILGHPDFTQPYILEVDASHLGLGAILSQNQESGKVVLGYASRSLRRNERNMDNYSSRKLELLALKWAVTEKYRDLLLGAKIFAYTDNDPLSFLQTTAKLSATETRWVGDLASFDLTIRYKPGRANKNADSLSRKEEHESEVARLETILCEPLTSRLPCDLNLQIQQDVRTVTCESVDGTIARDMPIPSTAIPTITTMDMADLQKQDPAISLCLQYVEQNRHPSTKTLKEYPPAARKLFKLRKSLVKRDGVLHRIVNDRGKHRELVVIPEKLLPRTLKSSHDESGHPSPERTLSILRERCYWPYMARDIAKYCTDCQRCLLGKHGPSVKPRYGSIIASRPLEILAMDFTVLEKGYNNFENVLVLTDVFTKFTQAFPTKDQSAKTVANVLVGQWFVKFGVPIRLHSDQGKSFENKIIHELCKVYGVKKTKTTAYHPEGNGQCERFNNTMHTMLRTLPSDQKKKWPCLLPALVYAYNSTPHASTGYSPYFLFYGRDPKLPVDLVIGSLPADVSDLETDWVTEHHQNLQTAYQQATKRTEAAALKRKKALNVKANDKEIAVGARVFVRNHPLGRHKIQDIWRPEPYRVVEKREPSIYVVIPLAGGQEKAMHRSELLDTRTLIPDIEPVSMYVHTAPTSPADQPSNGYVSPDSEDNDDVLPESTIFKLILADTVSESMENEQKDKERDTEKAGELDSMTQQDSNEEEKESDAPVVSEDALQNDEADGEIPENRHSSRSTAGKHSNPNRLPMSAVQEEIGTRRDLLQDLSEAHLLLVTMLSKS